MSFQEDSTNNNLHVFIKHDKCLIVICSEHIYVVMLTVAIKIYTYNLFL